MSRSMNYAIRPNAGVVEISVVQEGADPDDGDVDYMTPATAKAFAHSLRVAAITAERQMPRLK